MLTPAYLKSLPTTSIDYSELKTACWRRSTHLLCYSVTLVTGFLSLAFCLLTSHFQARLSIAAYMVPLLLIYHHSFTFTLQYDRFDHHPPTFLLYLVSELHLLLGASDLLDHESGTLPNHIKLAPSFFSFRFKLKTHLFT